MKKARWSCDRLGRNRYGLVRFSPSLVFFSQERGEVLAPAGADKRAAAGRSTNQSTKPNQTKLFPLSERAREGTFPTTRHCSCSRSCRETPTVRANLLYVHRTCIVGAHLLQISTYSVFLFVQSWNVLGVSSIGRSSLSSLRSRWQQRIKIGRGNIPTLPFSSSSWGTSKESSRRPGSTVLCEIYGPDQPINRAHMILSRPTLAAQIVGEEKKATRRPHMA